MKKIYPNWKIYPIGTHSTAKNFFKKFKKTKKTFLNNFLFFLVCLILIASILFSAMVLFIKYNLPSPEKLLARNVAQSTKIYDREGKVILYEIFAEQRRTVMSLNDIPKDLINATLAAEDKDFFKHPGFDFKAIVRAIIIDILKGTKAQGGSTLTQQFIKNAFLTSQKTYQRKITEILLAYQMEKKYSKEEILQMYFNEIPYGSNAYGVEAATQIYFNKSAKDLSLDEAALLAALTKAPTYFSPFGEHKEELLLRRDRILQTMVEENYISPEAAEEAKKINTLEKISPRYENIIAPHFVMYIKELLTKNYGERLVERGGLKVITTLDINKQKIAEEAIARQAEKNEKIFKATNASLISIDVKTGQILALVGSKDFFNQSIDGQVNITLQPRQPGSSFKPVVYAAAFEKGFTPETIVFDVETNFGPDGSGEKDYVPQNYNGKFYGPVTLRQALAGSLNIPSVKLLYLTGIDRVLGLAQKMGYTTLSDKSRFGLSLVLGGGEVKLLEHTAAFGIFAREGQKIPISAILKVEDSQGKILEENKFQNNAGEPVISPQTARLINDILSDNQARSFIFGEKNYLTLPDRPAAVKTGTTNNFRDAWTIGYTPDLVTGVWVGNNRNEAMKEKADGSRLAAPIWQEFMIKALANVPIKNFTAPEPCQVNKPILKGDLPDEIILEIDQTSGKLATELTPDSQKAKKVFKKYYPILYYLNKDDPLGPAPENPFLDPQYERWLKGIQSWAEKIKKESPMNAFEIPPSEFDDLHIPANQPIIEIISPQNNALIDEQSLEIKIKARAPRGINKIICYVDSAPVDLILSPKDENQTYQCLVNFIGLEAGEHKITITALDDIENSKSQDFWITLTKSFEQKLSWLNLPDEKILFQKNFPFTLSVSAPAIKIKTVKFFAQNLNSLKTHLLGTVFYPDSSRQIDFKWPMADLGRYLLWVELTDAYNRVLSGEQIILEIK